MGQGDCGHRHQARVRAGRSSLSSIGNFRPIPLRVRFYNARGKLMTKSQRRNILLRQAAGAAAAIVAIKLALSPVIAGNAALNLVLVLDGLRPDSITAEETPNLWRLRQEGVNFLNGHSVFPTVTRANATAIATGTYPSRNGIFGNTLYVREVN